MISGLPCQCDSIHCIDVIFVKNRLQLCQFCLYLNQIWYQDAPYIPFNACQIWRKSKYAFAFYDSFLQVSKNKKKEKGKKWRKWETLWRLIFQERLAQFTSDLVCVFLLKCWHLHNKFGFVWSRDHGTTNAHKIILWSSC